MKYLRKFESHIKHSDPISLNHPLKEFSKELENIIKNAEIKNTEVRRYFNEDQSITIKIFETHESILAEEILKFKIWNNDTHIFINIFFSRWKLEKMTDFVEYIRQKTMKYNSYDKPFRINFYFKKSEANTILKILKEYETQIQANKYNL